MRLPSLSIRPIVTLAAWGLALAGPAAAQDDVPGWQRQVRDQLDAMDEQVAEAGYQPVHMAARLVAGGQSEDATVELEAGRYVAAAVCDFDCSDVDLAVSLGGTTLDSDVLADDVPVVEFAVDRRGTLVFTVAMITCGTPSCGFGLRVYRQTGAGPAPAAGSGGSGVDSELAPWQQQVVEQLRTMDGTFAGEGFSATEVDFGLLGAGAVERVTFSLPSGQYMAAAVCDNDCGDVDLIVYDARGNQLDEDVLTDAAPIVDFKGRGEHQFEVRMVDCSTSTCGWGMRIYRQD